MINNQVKFKQIIALILVLIIFPSLIVSNSGNIEIINEEKNIDDITITEILSDSSVYYEDTIGAANDVYVWGDYAYVADHNSGLAVINISDPTNPGTPVYESTTGAAMGVYVSGDYAYVADWDSGLAVIEIFDPTNPGTPAYEATTSYAYGVYVSGDYVYMADGISGLAIINISNPANPGTPVYGVATDWAFNVYVSGDYAYVALEGLGLAVIQVRKRVDMVDPIIINSSSDFTVEIGYMGINISWSETDSNPSVYTVELQGSGIVAGPSTWLSGVVITYNVSDGLAVGEYFYTAKFTDNYDNFIYDTVKMTIEELTTDGNGGVIYFGNLYLIFLIFGIISLVIVEKRKI